MLKKDIKDFSWKPSSLIKNKFLRYTLIAMFIIYLFLAFSTLNINFTRVAAGITRSRTYFFDLFRPDFASRWMDIYEGLMESLTMTVVATVLGIIVSIPFAIGGAKNISPTPLYLFCRGIIILSRSFQEVIVAIFFVILIGFGPMAGVLTLVFASIGFISKLLAEEIESIKVAPLEAVRATGGSSLQVFNYAIMPQILPRFIGLSIYRMDINFRASAIIGVVGAGGIGSTLRTSFDRYEFSTASAMLIIIILIVLLGEFFSSKVRKALK